MEHAARTKRLLELRILGIVRQFRLFLGVEVIEIAEELVEAMIGWQMLVVIAQMVLAKLASCISLSQRATRSARLSRDNSRLVTFLLK
jgi:hypothetical protein